jgi:transposase-like protein
MEYETGTIPPISKLIDLFFNEESCISFLFEKEVFYRESVCRACGTTMKLYLKQKIFQCRKKMCRKGISIRNGSFFVSHKLPCSKILFLGYLWLTKISISSALLISGCSKSTISSFYGYFRQLAADSLELEDCIIGGEGVVVEIDETKLGKRKYNRGHRVEGVWVIGGVERMEEGKVFLARVEDRSAATLEDVIRRYVRPGSIIHTDMWRGYSQLGSDGIFSHSVVNHSENFKDPVTGVHTNTIEGTWNGLKMQIKPRNRTKGEIEYHLWEFIWRKVNRNGLWSAFLKSLRDVLYE